MAGSFSFARSGWSSSWSAVYYVMRFLAERVPDPVVSDEITELIDNNVPLLDLSSPEQAPLVDIIANDLLRHGPPVAASPEYQSSFNQIMVELVDCAREQQDYNRDPTGPSCYRIGPSPARYFDLDPLMQNVFWHLEEVDSVRIDVSYYTAEQRAALKARLVELADARVVTVGEDAVAPDAPDSDVP